MFLDFTQPTLQKIKLASLKAEAKLQTQINTVEDEVKVLKDSLTSEKEKYASYEEEVKQWKLKQAIKHKSSVSSEQDRFKSTEAEYQKEAKECQAHILEAGKEITILKDKESAQLKIISKIEITKSTRIEAKKKIGLYKVKSANVMGKLSKAKAEYTRICEMGTPGVLLFGLCAKMREEVTTFEKEIAAINQDIAKFEDSFKPF